MRYEDQIYSVDIVEGVISGQNNLMRAYQNDINNYMALI